MNQKQARWGQTCLVFIEFVGFSLAFYLFLISARILFPENVPCPRSGLFACNDIVRGRFSHIGPFPISALGLLYFVGHLALTGLLTLKGDIVRLLKMAGVISGLAFIAYLRALELVYLHKICPWCYGVAFMVLVQAVVMYPLSVPPLPKMKTLGIIISVLSTFVLFILAGSVVAYAFGSAQAALGIASTISTPASFSGDKPVEDMKPEETPKPTAPPKASATDVTTLPAPIKPDAKATKTPEPTAEAGTADLKDFAESSLDTDETKVLRSHGWRIAGSHDAAIYAIKQKPPVLLLAFDPLCEECAHLILKQLPNSNLSSLQVTLVAIEQSLVEGQLSAQIPNVPALLLVGADGKVIYKHIGRIEGPDLRREISEKLPK
ncbi:MAG: hypothetical protein K1X53_06165 [Candidatus Sumerlaeaceae bacterium]|nr:hypothetical protein [Candidatus Sumerlaeaceae bacterium]